MDGATVDPRFHARQEEAGLAPIRWHDPRHGFATIKLALGVSHKTISAAMGRGTPLVTPNTYMHVPEELLHEAAGRLDRGFGTG